MTCFEKDRILRNGVVIKILTDLTLNVSVAILPAAACSLRSMNYCVVIELLVRLLICCVLIELLGGY